MSAMAVLDAYFAAFNAHDVAGVAGLFRGGGTYADSAVPEAIGGRAIEDFLSVHFSAFPDGKYRIVRSLEDPGGVIAVEWIFSGTHLGSLGGIAASKRGVEMRGATFMQSEQGRIVWLRGYYDRRALMKSLVETPR